MGLPANKINAMEHPFQMQWACRQTKLSLWNTHFACNGPAGNKIITMEHPFRIQWACRQQNYPAMSVSFLNTPVHSVVCKKSHNCYLPSVQSHDLKWVVTNMNKR